MNSLTQITSHLLNAQQRKKENFSVPFTTFVLQFACILYKQGFIQGFQRRSQSLDIFLKYQDTKPIIQGISHISKPSHKVYFSVQNLKRLPASFDVYIVSTSKGLLTSDEAQRQNLGGKVLCKIQA